MALNLVNALDALAPRLFENELVSIHKIASEDDIGYAVCGMRVLAERRAKKHGESRRIFHSPRVA